MFINYKKTLFFLFFAAGHFAVQAQQSTNSKPQMVGEGVISTTDFEFNFTTTQDSKLAFFSKALLPDWRRMSIMYSEQKNGKWQKPKLAPFSGQYRDADPFISPDQSTLVFISDRPSKYQKKKSDYSLWMVKAPFLKKQEPVLLEGDIYKNLVPLYPSLAANGNLYFSASDSTNDSDIYFARLEDGKYNHAQKLSFNTDKHRDLDPIVAPDESFVVFTSATRKGLGGSDLYVSFNNNGQWTEPINLGNGINSPSSEGQPGISGDGKKLYFASPRATAISDYAPREKPISNSKLKAELNSPVNGLPNIWEVSIEEVLKLKPSI
ncbi:MAG TPA: hypothetical protein VEV16_00575 [Daejeonella sp.]|nr:hypothetical protein [Daejeonella sp.]